MKPFCFLLQVALLLTLQATAQLTPVSADITPSAGGRYEHLTADGKGNIYVFQNLYPEAGRLWRYDQMKWTTLDLEGKGWGGAIELVTHPDGTLYLWAAAAKGDKYRFYQWQGGQWSALPVLDDTNKPSGLFIGPNKELMLYGHFQLGGSTTYLLKWSKQQWEPVVTTVSDKFLKYLLDERKCRSLLVDKNGTLYARFFKYEKPTRNYFAICKNNTWSLLDTAAVTFNSTVRDMALDSRGQLYVAGFFADDTKSRCLARWDGTGWSILSKKEDPIECIAINEQDDVLFAGEIGPYKKKNVQIWKNNAESTWAGSEEYFYKLALAGNTLFAVTGIGSKYIFKINAGEFALTPGKTSPAITTGAASTGTASRTERKDEKPQEVWAIYNSYLTDFYPAFEAIDNELRAMLKVDDKGKFPNQVVWKSSAYRIRQGTVPLRSKLEELTKRLNALALAKGANTLADDLLEAVNSYSRFSYATDGLMDQMAYTLITQELLDALAVLEKAGKNLNATTTRLNKTAAAYKQKNELK
ncbi:MAG TPA: hypothetical protein PKE63_00675 [Lacibacter sp.]|nr:hypothetical protein [Lacibacter sp.]